MPTYVFKNTLTGSVEEHVVKLSDYDEFTQNNPNLQRYYDSAHIGELVRGINQKPDSDFRDILKHIKKKHRNSTINDF